ncbi:AHH domain-containing protein [Sorangium sp. So ce429]
MTQVGEAVGPDLASEDECPFDHATEKDPPSIENSLIGKGGTLKSKMESGTSTHKYAYDSTIVVGHDPRKKVLSPRNRRGHPFEDGKKAVSVTGADGVKRPFPVSCAAHHCIPAQESLKRSKILAFMVQKGKTAELKDTSYKGCIVWANVGYDVNGCENGVFLPGSYAVSKSSNGSNHWKDWSDGADDEEDDDIVSTDENAATLQGAIEINDANYRWQYVREAVQLTRGQFHDRHVDYSDFVLSSLDKLFERYKQLKKEMVDENGCTECKKNSDKMKNHGLPTPFVLVARMNFISRKLAGWLNAITWRRNIYTSRWGNAYMESLKKQ